MFLTHLVCSSCGAQHDAQQLQNLCTKCQKPLLAKYDIKAISRKLTRQKLRARADRSLWRFRELLPLPQSVDPISLDEGGTPLLRADRFGGQLGLSDLWIKDESVNPTQSFKARARLEAHIFMPCDTPRANIIECRQLGAHVTLIDGLITDCGSEIARRKTDEGWFEMSTLKEPYRLEGKKTLGYELAEQLGWRLPEVILYPTGGGTGLIGMWKAFSEMEALGWIDGKRPRMYSVQASGCAPIVRAFEAGADEAAEFPNAQTRASGLRVPKAIGDFLMLRILRESGGGAIAIDDDEMIRVTREVGGAEGLFIAPEGAACFAALRSLIDSGTIKRHEHVVVFNTGSGIKYLECYE
jgi:threonine synthase